MLGYIIGIALACWLGYAIVQLVKAVKERKARNRAVESHDDTQSE